MTCRNDGVTVSLLTFAEGYMGMSRWDVELARAISGAAQFLAPTPKWSEFGSLVIGSGGEDGPPL